MNFLGIGPGELILILVILLLVVGPDRLPQLARQTGRMLVTLRNWVQRSPDAAMVMRARQEIEQELATLRASLLEVQNVRNEVIEAARQVSTTVSDDLIAPTRDALAGASGEAQSALNGLTVARGQTTEAAPAAPEPATPAVEAVEATSAPPRPPVETGVDELPAVGAAVAAQPAAPVELEQLNARLQAMLEEMRALQDELRQRGLIGADWRPPAATLAETEERAR
ncbi:MAG TPA: twin-arginine translocase TatA/TatE family subunit [Roseiflexaceae bacterium]|nr:twin-arginine translocase TatA/TatE family subunit [Roseiflexaceae bacterium]